MRKIFTIFTLIFTFYIHSEAVLIKKGGNDGYSFSDLRDNNPTYEQYIKELIELKPLTEGTSRKEKSTFRVKFYTLHGIRGLSRTLGSVCRTSRGSSECYGNEKFPYDSAVATLDAMLLLNDYLEKYGASKFIGLAKHTKGLWDKTNRFNHLDLVPSLRDGAKLNTSSFEDILEYAIPAARSFKIAESYDIGFKGPAEVFSQEYNERIRKRIEYIDKESGDILSILAKSGTFKEYSEIALKNSVDRSIPSIKMRFQNICEDIFDDEQIKIKNRLEANYLKEIDFCAEKDRDAFITGIYTIDSEVLKNYSPDFYYTIFYNQFFPTWYDRSISNGELLRLGPEILFNARYGVSSGLNITKVLIDYKTDIQNTFYENIASLKDIKDKALDCCSSLSSLSGFKKLIYPPRDDTEERIYEAFEDYLGTDEFRQNFMAAMEENKLLEILKDPVVTELIEQKTAMEIVKKCYESRVGYAVIYINQNEYMAVKSKFNKNFKETSSKLSPEINKIIDVHGFNNFINWGVELALVYSGIESLANDWSQANSESCKSYKMQLQ